MWMNIILFFIGVFTAAYFYYTRNFGYFRSRGLPEVPSSFPFGADEAAKMATGRASVTNFLTPIYQQYKQLPAVGYIALGKPVLVINDLELAKQILIKDFDHFINRRSIAMSDNESNRIFSRMLTVMEGDKWKQIRTTLSPVFTSGKLKAMTAMINKVGKDFLVVLEKKAKDKEEFLMKDLMINYMLDNIASCGFGVEANALLDKESQFKKMVEKITGGSQTNPKLMFKFLLVMNLPFLTKIINFSLLDDESVHFFIDVIKQTIAHRRANNIKKNDFIDLTIAALKNEIDEEKDNDQFEKDAEMKKESGISTKPIPDDELESYLISNLFVLFFAGFDTSSTTLTIASFYLARNPDIQERLYEEIMEYLSDRDMESLDYTKAHSLPYLDMVVNETLRCYPLTFIERKCSKPYKLPGTDFVVPKDMLVQIPNGGIMKDPKFFPNPDKFDPENFSTEHAKERNPYAFLAFGQGPRNCIGMRFALMSVKICLIFMIRHYKIVATSKTIKEAIPDPLSQSAQPKGGVWLKVEKRE